jgi:hypothetical protein
MWTASDSGSVQGQSHARSERSPEESSLQGDSVSRALADRTAAALTQSAGRARAPWRALGPVPTSAGAPWQLRTDDVRRADDCVAGVVSDEDHPPAGRPGARASGPPGRSGRTSRRPYARDPELDEHGRICLVQAEGHRPLRRIPWPVRALLQSRPKPAEVEAVIVVAENPEAAVDGGLAAETASLEQIGIVRVDEAVEETGPESGDPIRFRRSLRSGRPRRSLRSGRVRTPLRPRSSLGSGRPLRPGWSCLAGLTLRPLGPDLPLRPGGAGRSLWSLDAGRSLRSDLALRPRRSGLSLRLGGAGRSLRSDLALRPRRSGLSLRPGGAGRSGLAFGWTRRPESDPFDARKVIHPGPDPVC